MPAGCRFSFYGHSKKRIFSLFFQFIRKNKVSRRLFFQFFYLRENIFSWRVSLFCNNDDRKACIVQEILTPPPGPHHYHFYSPFPSPLPSPSQQLSSQMGWKLVSLVPVSSVRTVTGILGAYARTSDDIHYPHGASSTEKDLIFCENIGSLSTDHPDLT